MSFLAGNKASAPKIPAGGGSAKCESPGCRKGARAASDAVGRFSLTRTEPEYHFPVAWHILIPLVWLAASLGFALGWAVRALLERRVAREPRPAGAPSEETPGSAGWAHTTTRRTRSPAPLKGLALKGAGGALALLTASAGLAYAGIDFPGTVLERTFRTVLRIELPNQRPAEIGARPSRGRGSSAVDVEAGPLRGAPASGCDAVQGEVTSSDGSGGRAGGSPCSESEDARAGKGSELRRADGSGSGRHGAVQSANPPGDDAAATESIAQESEPEEGERSAEEGGDTSAEARPSASNPETKPSPERGTKGGGASTTKESAEGQKPSPETSGKGRGSPPKENIGGASSDDAGPRDKTSSDDQADVDHGRRDDGRSGGRSNATRGGKRGGPPEVG